MAEFDSRHRVFKAMSARIGSHKLFVDFWQCFDVAVIQDDVTGVRAVDNDYHNELCQVLSMTDLAGVTRDTVLEWMTRNQHGLYEWLSYEAEREGTTIQGWFVERGITNAFTELVRYGMGDTNVDIDEARKEIGNCVADEFLYMYQYESQKEGIYVSN